MSSRSTASAFTVSWAALVGGGFLPDGEFEPAPAIDTRTVRELFEAKVFAMLQEDGLIGRALIQQIKSWKHTGFDASSASPQSFESPSKWIAVCSPQSRPVRPARGSRSAR